MKCQVDINIKHGLVDRFFLQQNKTCIEISCEFDFMIVYHTMLKVKILKMVSNLIKKTQKKWKIKFGGNWQCSAVVVDPQLLLHSSLM